VAHPFYEQLNRLLEERGFDDFVEQHCARFYAERMGHPSLTPGQYFRLLLIGYFEGIDGERGIAWRAADSLALRCFLGVGLNEMPPDHSTISRTRRLIDVETHQVVFCWVLEWLAEKGLVKGKTVRIDATTLEANAAMRFDCAARYGRRLPGVSAAAGTGIGDLHAHARAVGEAGPQACEEGIE
jgi:transposase